MRMKFSIVWCVRWVILSANFVYFITAEDEEIMDEEIIDDMFTLEKMYRDLHPNLQNTSWPLLKDLTLEKHRSLCHQVLTQSIPPEEIDKYEYEEPEAALVRKSRILRNCPLYFQRTGVEYVPVIVCKYADTKIYLCHGDDKHVFRVDRDQDNIFTFRSGLHPYKFET